MNMNKLNQWIRVSMESDQHLDNAHAAQQAYCDHLPDRAKDVERVVDKHLKRIAQREIALCDLCEAIASSPALELGDEE